jgi:hypothetical protein
MLHSRALTLGFGVLAHERLGDVRERERTPRLGPDPCRVIPMHHSGESLAAKRSCFIGR